MRFAFAAWSLVFLLTGVRFASAEPRIAPLIGNNAYTRVPALDNPVNDARAMDQALRGFGFEVIRLENASKAQIETGLLRFTQRLTPDAVSLVYYAGHGVQIGGRNYLIPADAAINNEAALRATSVDVDAVIERIASRHGRISIIIFDACRNNPFLPPQTGAALAGGAGPSDTTAASRDCRFRSVSGGLAAINAPSGILIAYATAPGMVAADGAGANGLYTAELIRAMSTPGAAIEGVFKMTRRAVMQQSGGAQIPWESSSLTAEFCIPPAGSTRRSGGFDRHPGLLRDCLQRQQDLPGGRSQMLLLVASQESLARLFGLSLFDRRHFRQVQSRLAPEICVAAGSGMFLARAHAKRHCAGGDLDPVAAACGRRLGHLAIQG
jgi:hypothetical protein